MKLKYVFIDLYAQAEYSFKIFMLKHFPAIARKRWNVLDVAAKKTKLMNPAYRLSCMVGRNTYCAKDVKVIHSQTTIGSYCSISQGTMIGPGEHPTNFLSTSPAFYMGIFGWRNRQCNFEPAKPCKIGNDVWLGYNVFIKQGVTIGDGAIVGACSVVVKDVPPYAIVAGTPARIIRYRFDEQTIKDLLVVKWWDLDDEVIQKIPFENINEAVKFLKEIRSKENV